MNIYGNYTSSSVFLLGCVTSCLASIVTVFIIIPMGLIMFVPLACVCCDILSHENRESTEIKRKERNHWINFMCSLGIALTCLLLLLKAMNVAVYLLSTLTPTKYGFTYSRVRVSVNWVRIVAIKISESYLLFVNAAVHVKIFLISLARQS